MAAVFLAGAFDPSCCEIRIYNEHASGPVLNEALLAWPDMLVLTGLTLGFDRMLHWTAYVRSRNPAVIVVAGGPAIRALPIRASKFFDYVCLGDVEEIREVITEALGPCYLARAFKPRYDLLHGMPWLSYVESSRNCNFRCGFCSLTGEGVRYQKYSLENIRYQIVAQGRRRHVCFIDNNFYGNNHKFFKARIELLEELREEGWFHSWSALVTQDFFAHRENLSLVRQSGCQALFTGLESFSADSLKAFNKRQNNMRNNLDFIDESQEVGIMILYGMIFDVTRRRIQELQNELELVLESPGFPLPSYCVLAIPLLGTPYFKECVVQEKFLPNTRLRDLDCFTLALKPLDPIDQVVSFVSRLPNMRGYRRRIAIKTLDLIRRYRKQFGPLQLSILISNAAILGFPGIVTRFGQRNKHQGRYTHISATELLDPLYIPRFWVASKFRNYFCPTMVTDATGSLADDMLDDYGTNDIIDRSGSNTMIHHHVS